jgi:single-strand DNA-binding protein
MPNHASAHIIGHVGRDPESDTTSTGIPRTRFSVAVNVYTGQAEKETNWYAVTCFGKLAEVAEQYITKGMSVYVDGPQRIRTYEGRDGQPRTSIDIKATELQMLSRDESERPPQPVAQTAQKSAPRPAAKRSAPQDDDDSGLPF